MKRVAKCEYCSIPIVGLAVCLGDFCLSCPSISLQETWSVDAMYFQMFVTFVYLCGLNKQVPVLSRIVLVISKSSTVTNYFFVIGWKSCYSLYYKSALVVVKQSRTG